MRSICGLSLLVLLLADSSVAGEHHGKTSIAPSALDGSSRLVQDRQRLRVSNKRAAELVKKRYASSRVLGVSLIDGKGPPLYRVKTLSENGVVRSVFVDGSSGEVFE